jgi:type I restriction enzyme S subunit
MSEVSFMEKLLDGVEVEWRTLGEVSRFVNGRAYKQQELLESGKYPVLRVGNFFTNNNWYYSDLELSEDKYCDNGDLLYAWSASFGPRIWEGEKVIYHYHIWKVLPEQNMVLKKFLYYLLAWDTNAIKDEHAAGSTMLHISKSAIEKRLVPTPCPENPKKSLEIQAEIVRILDTFTELTAELTAELSMRKKQYNYYRDKLLTFEEGDVEWKTLGDLTIDRFWIMPATPKFDENEVVPYITSKNIKGGHIDFNKVKFISRQDYINLTRNRPILAGDFLISMIGTIGEIALVKESDLDFYGQNMYLIRLNENMITNGYFLHFFDSPKMKGHFNSVKNNSGQGYLKANNIEDILVPVPSLADQNRIVAILDKFDTLTNSITEGLPHEIELRQKQYEYYRDLLLSFPKPDEQAA